MNNLPNQTRPRLNVGFTHSVSPLEKLVKGLKHNSVGGQYGCMAKRVVDHVGEKVEPAIFLI